MTAKEAILSRIRASSAYSSADPQEGWANIQRRYKRAGTLTGAEKQARFEHRLRDYDAGVLPCGREHVPETIARVLEQRGARRIVIPPGIPAAWLPSGFDFILDTGFSAQQLDRMDGVLTTASVAIAETGTLVLQSVPGQGRRALTLVPDYHLCLVFQQDVVETVAEALAFLQPGAMRATTFISGPSATADIEMTRIKGVHGPRFLDVLLIA